MFIVTHPKPNRVDIELSAMLDSNMMSAGLDALIDAAKDIEHGKIMYKIPSFSMPTGGAIATEMMRLPDLFRAIRHFDRCAVVSDYDWIRVAASVEGALMPGLTIKTFPFNEEQEAENWLATGNTDDDNDDPNVPV